MDEKKLFNWEAFTRWCNETGVPLDNDEDYIAWWECWKTAYSSAIYDL